MSEQNLDRLPPAPPDQGLKWQPLSAQDDARPPEPHRPGLHVLIFQPSFRGSKVTPNHLRGTGRASRVPQVLRESPEEAEAGAPHAHIWEEKVGAAAVTGPCGAASAQLGTGS